VHDFRLASEHEPNRARERGDVEGLVSRVENQNVLSWTSFFSLVKDSGPRANPKRDYFLRTRQHMLRDGGEHTQRFSREKQAEPNCGSYDNAAHGGDWPLDPSGGLAVARNGKVPDWG
jgi:hypothetical protein